ncbi:MAG: Stp1/IreP family PP2C-type Ser/Thr phosphatase [Lachnospiraceae bacterium]|nr:Stp1/IreP family PP2C-type Ser/Thr phosphatase [Lachnospiraceae bacterium]
MKIFSMTDVGKKREINQDFIYTSDEQLGNLPNLFVVADGMGGHRAGDFASKYTVEILEREIKVCEETRPEIILRNAIQIANNKIIEAAADDEHLKGMGTTVVAATIIDHMIYFANVGDSRLYLINQEITQMTKDHSLVEEMVRMGGIRQEDAKHHPDKNIITRAIGAKDRIEIDFYEYRLKKGDTILMCTDGLSNLVDDEEMFHIIKSSRDIVEAGVELIETANNNGGSDNISVVIVEPFVGEVSIC